MNDLMDLKPVEKNTYSKNSVLTVFFVLDGRCSKIPVWGFCRRLNFVVCFTPDVRINLSHTFVPLVPLKV